VPTPTPPAQQPQLLPELPGLPPVAKLRLDADQQVLAYTASACRIIQANPCSLTLSYGRLRQHPDPKPLRDALRWVCEPGSAGRRERALSMQRVGAAPLTLRLSRHHEPGTGAMHAVAWLADPDQFHLDEAGLQQAFEFTATEARVAVALAAGASAAELAQAWGLRANTVQMHIKHLLAKTHTSRQAQLVGLLWRSALLRLPTPPAEAAGARVCPSHTSTQTGSDGEGGASQTLTQTVQPH
jgi:DNA-binding CsgD family transcriptional regulator